MKIKEIDLKLKHLKQIEEIGFLECLKEQYRCLGFVILSKSKYFLFQNSEDYYLVKDVYYFDGKIGYDIYNRKSGYVGRNIKSEHPENDWKVYQEKIKNAKHLYY